ncbi:biotin-dependent carboxyltransferase family protein [Nonomuraea sp. NPDC050536]|uniref:biotin-dependent carboxyltransferase family protein n=1 Tax=Nonomuraea sp. NPDC050536 TaxID=3364366 RepID=UPI0037CCC28D
MIEVLAPGPYATVQDLGRPGYAHLGVPHSGAADTVSLRLGNRLVGNPEGLAGIELTYGGARLAFRAGAWIAVTGAPCPLSVSPSAAGGYGVPFWVPPGAVVTFGAPRWGLRTYVAVRGGIDVEPVLGSRSTDSLSGLGPPALGPGTALPVGTPGPGEIVVDLAPPGEPPPGVLRVVPGPRDDWFVPGALATLCGSPYQVTQDSNRVGVRLSGRELARSRAGELPSEGMVPGAIQVPPSGQPIIFLADHPPTGGYPVIAVLRTADLPTAAQLPPGTPLHFTLHP